jgi:pimeloyl-ACP methyl ester carboxylesterase
MNVHGRELECQWWGRRDRHTLPIVLLHEGLGSVSRWRDFPAVLADETQRAVFAFSRWGHGQSDPPLRPHTTQFMHDEARLLPSILAAAGIPRAIVLGHSDGGSIALMFAAEHPACVDSLILEAPHVFVEDLSITSIEQTTTRFRDGDLRARLARHHQHVDVAFHGWSDVWLDPAFRAWNIEEYLARVHCPVLLIQGTGDEYGTLRQLDAIEEQVAGPVQRLVLAGCGHAPHRDQRTEVLSAVKAFVSSRD